MLDTLNTATAASDVATILPLVGGGGAVSVAVLILIYYRDVFIGIAKRILGKERDEERKQIIEDVKELKERLERCWAEQELRLSKLEVDVEVSKTQTKGQHEETLRLLSAQNERIGEINDNIKLLYQALLQDRK